MAVAIVIGPRSSGAEASGADSSFVSHVFEFAIAKVVIECVAAVPGDINIGQAVVVIVGDSDSHAPALASQSGGLGDVGEFEAGVLMIERDQEVAAVLEMVNRRTIHRDNVEFAVVITINEPNPTAHGFDDVLLVRSRDVWDGETDLTGNILETRRWGYLAPDRATENWNQEKKFSYHDALNDYRAHIHATIVVLQL